MVVTDYTSKTCGVQSDGAEGRRHRIWRARLRRYGRRDTLSGDKCRRQGEDEGGERQYGGDSGWDKCVVSSADGAGWEAAETKEWCFWRHQMSRE